MFHTLIIASTRRPQVLHETVASLSRQTVAPDELILVTPYEDDVEPRTLEVPGVRRVLSEAGLSRQRNRGIDEADAACQIITFVDDDVALADDYLEHAQRFFAEHDAVVLMTGATVADGAGAGGLTRAEAEAAVRGSNGRGNDRFEEGQTAYGCNMTVRRAVASRVRFDERLPLYSWLEDLDFSMRCRAEGGIGRYRACRMAHLGVSSGRVSGVKYGYSQIMNPYYLYRKGGVITLGALLYRFWFKGFAANLGGTLWPFHNGEVDRFGRLRGNLLALLHALLCRVEPEYITKL